MYLAFDGLKAPVALNDCDDLVDSFAPLIRGWRFAESRGEGAAPSITITRIADGYLLDSPTLARKPETYETEEFGDECAVVCAFLADLIVAFARDTPTQFCLHCAGLEIGGKLIAFPATGRAGKSTLSVHLMAAGARYFSDDVLPICETNGKVTALGFAPRLRLPLTETAEQRFLEYVERRTALANERYRYVLPETSIWAPHGEQAPISAVVLLERVPDMKSAELEPASKSATLQRMVKQNFESKLGLSERFRRLYELVDDASCFKLRYADTGEGIPLLLKAFAGSRE